MSNNFTPFTSPTIIPNSGSGKFSAQRAAIYKINFFNEMNNLEYNNYINARSFIQNNVLPGKSTFPIQENLNPQFYTHKRYNNMCNENNNKNIYYTYKNYINYC